MIPLLCVVAVAHFACAEPAASRNDATSSPAKTFPGRGVDLLTDGRLNPACTIVWDGRPVHVDVDFGRARAVGGVRIVAARSWVNCGVRKASFYAAGENGEWKALKEHVEFRPANTYGEVWAEWTAAICRKARIVIEETWDRKNNYYGNYTMSASYDMGRMFGGPIRDIWGDGAWADVGGIDAEGQVQPARWEGGKATVQIAEISFWDDRRPDDLPRNNRPDEAFPPARLIRDWAYQACAPSGNVSLVANATADTSRPDALGTDISQVKVDEEACRRRRVAFLEPFRAKFSQFIYVKHHVLGNSILHATDDLTDWTFKEWRRIPDYGGKSQLCLATINADGTVSNEVLVDCPDGVVRDPALSLDARRVVFSMRHDMTNDDYHLYELDLGTRTLRQLTFDAEHDGRRYPCSDIEPCFVPDGSLVFQSTRCSHSIDCWPLPVSNLYRCDADGRNIRRLGFDQVNTFYPQLLDDGRVLYSRWEYNDRTSGFALGLMVMNPDGSHQTGFALCNSTLPTSVMHARGIPGTGRAIFVDAGHHCGQKGHLAEVDPALAGDYDAWTYSADRALWGVTKHPTTRSRYRGKTDVKIDNWPHGKNPAAASPTLKGVFSLAGSATSGAAGRVPYPMPRLYKYPACETGYSQTGPQWAYPFPLGEGRFLVSFMPEGDRFQRGPFSSRLGVYAMDETGRRELLAFDWLQHAMQPVPVIPRKVTPRKLAPIDWTDGFGTFYVQNVYEGAAMEGAPKGCVKKLRVVAISYRAAHIGWNGQYYARMVTTDGKIGTPVSAGNGSYDIKHVLGEADVEADGSCSVRVPARTPVYFQLVDGNGCAVQTMRSWATLAPGEVNGCIGCHERPGSAADSKTPAAALRRAPQRLKPFVDGKEHPVLALLEKDGPLASVRNFMGVNWMEKEDGKSNNGAFSFTRDIQPILDRACIRCHDGSRPEPALDKLGGIPAKPTCFDLRGIPGEIPSSDDNSHRAYTRAYLNLSCRGFDNDKINFSHGLDNVPFQPPYSFGAATSDYYRMLVDGHPDASGRPRVALSGRDKKLLAVWIDLCVPFAGAYTEANTWSEEHRRRYFWFQNKRVFFAWHELNDIRGSLGLSRVPLTGIIPGVTPPRVQTTWFE